VSESAKVDPAALRRARAQLLSLADSASAAFDENHAAVREASEGWIGASKQALEPLVAHWSERDREMLAGLRDLAHHMPSVTSADTSTDDDSVESE